MYIRIYTPSLFPLHCTVTFFLLNKPIFHSAKHKNFFAVCCEFYFQIPGFSRSAFQVRFFMYNRKMASKRLFGNALYVSKWSLPQPFSHLFHWNTLILSQNQNNSMFSRLHDTLTHPQWNFLPNDTSADPKICADGKAAGLWKKRKKGGKKTTQVIFSPDALCPSALLFFLFHQRQHQTLLISPSLCVWLLNHPRAYQQLLCLYAGVYGL